MPAATLSPTAGGTTTEETQLAAPVKVFDPEGRSVNIPEETDRTVQFYLDQAGVTVGDSDVVYLDGRAITPDTIVPVGEATHVITVSSEIACG